MCCHAAKTAAVLTVIGAGATATYALAANIFGLSLGVATLKAVTVSSALIVGGGVFCGLTVGIAFAGFACKALKGSKKPVLPPTPPASPEPSKPLSPPELTLKEQMQKIKDKIENAEKDLRECRNKYCIGYSLALEAIKEAEEEISKLEEKLVNQTMLRKQSLQS